MLLRKCFFSSCSLDVNTWAYYWVLLLCFIFATLFLFLLLQHHSSVLPFKFIIEIFNFLLCSLQLDSFLPQDFLHLDKCCTIYFHLKMSNCECIHTHKAHVTPNSLTTIQRVSHDPRYLVLVLYFCSAEKTKPLPDRWTQAFWRVLWSIQLLHGLK